MHYRQGIAVPIDRELGWVIPKHLRARWNLLLGESTKVLPRILKDVSQVDMFIHDSRHTYRTMIKEFSVVFPYLREGGFLLAHDARYNDSLLDFCEKVGRTPMIWATFGVIRK